MGSRVDTGIERQFAGGISRRGFLRSLGIVAATLGIPKQAIAAALAQAAADKHPLPVIWLGLQGCTGEAESLLRAGPRRNLVAGSLADPGIVELLRDVISLEYHETLMAPAGAAGERSLRDTIARFRGQYLAVVEGAVPTAGNGAYCVIGGRTALGIAEEVCTNALATLAAGTCATSGGLPAALPNPTGAKGLLQAMPSLVNVVNIPGCPANVVNIVSTIIYFIAYRRWPALDDAHRPLFAFGRTVHSQCPKRRRAQVAGWSDSRHRSGGCLRNMGCKGPQARSNCPTVKWNDGACWPIEAGHGCIGCTEEGFWDRLSPFYVRSVSRGRRD